MAADARLSSRGRGLSSLAQRDAVRAPSRRSIPFGPAARVDRQPVRQGLQRGQRGRWPRQHRASAGSRRTSCGCTRRWATRFSGTRLPGSSPRLDRRSLSQNARTFALLNMALSDAGVAVMDTKYHYNFWRPETAIRGGRQRWKRENRPGCVVCALHHRAVFPQLPVRTRDHELRRSRGARAHLRPARSFHHRVDSSRPGRDPQVHEAQGDHLRHRRCPRLRRHSLPVRPGGRRGAGTSGRAPTCIATASGPRGAARATTKTSGRELAAIVSLTSTTAQRRDRRERRSLSDDLCELRALSVETSRWRLDASDERRMAYARTIPWRAEPKLTAGRLEEAARWMGGEPPGPSTDGRQRQTRNARRGLGRVKLVSPPSDIRCGFRTREV